MTGATEPRRVVGALIRDPYDRIFVQRRSADRRLFPGCWDVVGGAVEEGESLLDALRREIAEETGWRLRRVLARVAHEEWVAEGLRHVESDYVVEVDGNLSSPALERDKHTGFAWIAAEEVSLLDENAQGSGSNFIKGVVTAAHTWLSDSSGKSRRTT
ncbi:NUDIX domain-containing protein [Streptomyces anulatus]|uniref:NUDIX hydrolase n=1 Tax=Streptomyces anulatus TaxID=1892 RepID=UPI00324A723A|nr:NUDIX domain-containing protein [Streptomyces anulatus]WSU27047.1 NUDIX domain-containing protein [Streptomyces anulatus]WSU94050.1 NUDIX domain-containing protein [Streptomyces anulatus]WSW81009.1 NUDIX domain-containing protein [Streptomyces anulatus]